MASAINLGQIALQIVADTNQYDTALQKADATARAFAATTLQTVTQQEAFKAVMLDLGQTAGNTAQSLLQHLDATTSIGISSATASQSLAQFAQAGLDVARVTDLGRIAMAGSVIANEDSSRTMGNLVNSVTGLNTANLQKYGIMVDLNAMYGENVNWMDDLTKRQLTLTEVLRQGELVVKAHGDALDSTSEQALSFTERLAGMGKTIAVVGGALTALSAIVTKSIVEATQYAARTEVTTATLHIIGENAGISAQKLDELRDSVKDLGITTQVSNQALTRMMQYELDLSKATSLARVAQDAAVIANENSSETLDMLIYGITTLNTRLLRNRGIMINLNQEYATYAKELGKRVVDLTVHERHQATLNAVLREGVKLEGAYEQAMELAGKRVTSLARLHEEFQNSLGQFFIPIMGAVVNIIFRVLEGFTELDRGTQRLIAYSAAAAAALTGLGGAAAILYGGFLLLSAKLALIGVSLSAILGPIALIAAAVIGLSVGLGALASHIVEQNEAFKAAHAAAFDASRTYEAYVQLLRQNGIPATEAMTKAVYDLAKAHEVQGAAATDVLGWVNRWNDIVDDQIKKTSMMQAKLYGVSTAEQDLDKIRQDVLKTLQARILAEARGNDVLLDAAIASGNLTEEIVEQDKAFEEENRRITESLAGWKEYNEQLADGTVTITSATKVLIGITQEQMDVLKKLGIATEDYDVIVTEVTQRQMDILKELGLATDEYTVAFIEATQEQIDAMTELGLATEGYKVIAEDANIAAANALLLHKEHLAALALAQEEYNSILLGARDERQTLADEEAIAVAELQIGLQEELASSLQSYEEERGKIVAWGTDIVTGEVGQGAIDRLAILDKNYADQDAALQNFWGVKIGNTRKTYALERQDLRTEINKKLIMLLLENDARLVIEKAGGLERHSAAMAMLASTMKTYGQKLKDYMDDLKQKMLDAGVPPAVVDELMGNLSSAIAQATDQAVAGVMDVSENARQAIANLWSEFDAGKDATDDLTDGIDDMGRASSGASSAAKKLADPLKEAADTVSKLASMVEKAQKAFEELAEYAVPMPDFTKGWERLREQINYLVNSVATLVKGFGFKAEDYEQFSAFGKALTDIAKAISAAVSAIEDIGGMERVVKFTQRVALLANYIGKMAQELIRVSEWREAIKGWEQVSLFVKAVADGVKLMNDAVNIVKNIGSIEAISKFGAKVTLLANYIGIMATSLMKVRQWRKAIENWEEASIFATAIAKGVAMMGDAVKVVEAIGNFEAIKGFGTKVALLARYIGVMATQLMEVRQWRKAIESWQQASEFAKAIAGGIALMSDALKVVEGIAGLRQIASFGAKATLLAEYIGVMATQLLEVRKWREAIESWQRVGEFAKAISEGIALMGDAIDVVKSVAKLQDIVDFGTKASLLAEYIGVMAVQLLEVRKWREAIESWQRVGEFAAAVSEGIALMSDAIDVVKGIAKLQEIVDFGAKATLLAEYIGTMAVQLLTVRNWRETIEAWQRVGDFAKAIADGIALMGDALEVIKGIAKLKEIVDFTQRVTMLVGYIAEMAVELDAALGEVADENMAEKFEAWAARLSPMLSFLGDAITIFQTLAEKFTTAIDTEALGYLTRGIQYLAQLVDNWLVIIPTDDETDAMVERFQAWANRLSPLLSFLGDAIAVFQALAEEFATAIDTEKLGYLTRGIQYLAQLVDGWLIAVPESDETDEMVEKFQAWADRLSPLVSIIGDSIGIFQALEEEFSVGIPNTLEALVVATQQLAYDLDDWLDAIDLVTRGTGDDEEFYDEVAEKLSLWAERLSPVLSIVGDAIGIFQALEEEFTISILDTMQSLIEATQQLANDIADWLDTIDLLTRGEGDDEELYDDVAEQLQLWADRLSPVVSIVGDAIGVFQALEEEFAINVPDTMEALIDATEQLAMDIASWLDMIELATRGEGDDEEFYDIVAEQLQLWADRLSPVVSIVGDALGVFKALEEEFAINVPDTMEALIDATEQLANDIASWLDMIALATRGEGDDEEFYDAVAEQLQLWADRLSPVVSIVGDALAVFKALEEEFSINVPDTMEALIDATEQLAVDIASWLAAIDLASRGEGDEEEFYDAVAEKLSLWAERLSPVVSIVGNALAVFKALEEKFTIDVPDTMEALIDATEQLATDIASWLAAIDLATRGEGDEEEFYDAVAEQLQLWANRLSPVVSIVSDAFAIFKALEEEFAVDIPPTLESLIDATEQLAIDIASWLSAIELATRGAGDDEEFYDALAEHLQLWVSRLSPVVSIVGDAIGIFKALGQKFTVDVPDVMETLIRATEQMVVDIASWLTAIELVSRGTGEDQEFYDAVAEKLQLWADRLSPVLSIISDAINVFKALGQKFTVVLPSNLQSLVQATQQVALQMAKWLGNIELSEDDVDLIAEKLALWAERISSVASILGSAVSIFKTLKEPIVVILPSYLKSLVEATEQIVVYIHQWLGAVEISADGTDAIAEDLKHWAERVSAIATILTRGMETLTEMKAWRRVTIADIEEKMTTFVKTWAWLIEEFDKLRKDVGDLEYEIVREFANTIQSIATGLQAALGLLTGLADFVPPAQTAVDEFTTIVKDMFKDFFDWVLGQGDYADQLPMDEEALTVVSVAASAMNNLMVGYAAAFQVLEGLPGLAMPTDEKIGEFTTKVKDMFLDFYQWVTGEGAYADRTGWEGFTEEGLAIANLVAEGIRGYMGALESALAVFAGLSDPSFAMPLSSTIDEFTSAVKRIYLDFYQWVTGTGVYAENWEGFEKEGVELSTLVAQGLEALMNGLKSALELFKDLGYYVSPLEYFKDALDQFMTDVRYVFTDFYDWVTNPATGLTEKGIEITTALGNAFQALFGGLESAVAVLEGVGYLFHPSAEKLAFFRGQVKDTFVDFKNFALSLGPDAIDAAAVFGDALSTLMSGLQSALGFITDLVEAKLPEFDNHTAPDWFKLKVGHFIDSIHMVIVSLQNWVVDDLGPEAALTAQWFAQVISNTVSGLSAALNLLVDLVEADLPTTDELSNYLDLILQMYEELAAGLAGVPGEIEEAAGGVADGIDAGLAGLPNPYSWKVAGGSYPDWLAAGIDVMLGEVITAVLGVKGELNPETKVAQWNAWYSHGWNLTQGMASGLTQGTANFINNAITYTVNTALATSNLTYYDTWYTAGKNYMQRLADGITDGLGIVEAAIDALRGLFPSSPAKWGPFSTLPDEAWVGNYLGGVEQQFDRGLGRMARMSAFQMPGVATAWGSDEGMTGAGNTYLNVNLHDATIRNDDDIHRLAQELAYEIRRQVGVA